MHLKKSPFYFLTILFTLFFYANSFATSVTFNAAQTNAKNFMGFGAMVWDGNQPDSTINLFQLPGFQMARINHEIRMPSGQTIPNNGTFADYQALWNSYGDPATDLSGVSLGHPAAQLKFLWLASIPCSFINSSGYGNSYCPSNCSKGCTLISGVNLQSLAYYLAAGAQHFNEKYGALASCPGCYQANFMELANEPNGNWDTQFTTAQYTQLVQLVYQQLKTYAPNTLITGPGVGNMDWTAGTDSYTSAILANPTALANLGAFSVHNYIYTKIVGTPIENKDPGTAINGYGQTADRYYFGNWYKSPNAKAPTKPVIVSEVNSNATGFHGVSYKPANGTFYCTDNTNKTCTIINTTPFGVRIYNYLISLLAGGANAALYWEAHDQTWEGNYGGYGLYDVNSTPRTIYTALLPLFQNIPVNSKILTTTSTQNGNDVYGAAFLAPAVSGTQCVILALANGTGKSGTLARTTTVTGLPKTATLSSSTTTVFKQLGTTVYQGQLVTPDPNTTTLTLANGTLTHTTSLANDTTVTVKACYPTT